jgi:hypothetical protein
MSDKQDSMQSEIRQKIYSLTEIAKYARVTTEFIQECEHENLIQVTQVRGSIGYSHETVRKLIRIRHLNRDLGLDLTAIDCILRMRRQIGHLQNQMHDMEQRMVAREQELKAEIQRLRKLLSLDSDWK